MFWKNWRKDIREKLREERERQEDRDHKYFMGRFDEWKDKFKKKKTAEMKQLEIDNDRRIDEIRNQHKINMEKLRDDYMFKLEEKDDEILGLRVDLENNKKSIGKVNDIIREVRLAADEITEYAKLDRDRSVEKTARIERVADKMNKLECRFTNKVIPKIKKMMGSDVLTIETDDV